MLFPVASLNTRNPQLGLEKKRGLLFTAIVRLVLHELRRIPAPKGLFRPDLREFPILFLKCYHCFWIWPHTQWRFWCGSPFRDFKATIRRISLLGLHGAVPVEGGIPLLIDGNIVGSSGSGIGCRG